MKPKEEKWDKFFKAFPFLSDCDDKAKAHILDNIDFVLIPAGATIFYEGDECKQLAFVLSGIVRVYKTGESGREITLYRLRKGESCILTASCIYSNSNFPAIAVAEEEVEAAVIPSYVFRSWINTYQVWRNYIFDLLSHRLSQIMTVLDEVAFRRMDIRIANFLLKLSADNSEHLKITHQDIALELGSSREVVSRILEQFAYDNILVLKRGSIILADIDKLKRKVNQEQF